MAETPRPPQLDQVGVEPAVYYRLLVIVVNLAKVALTRGGIG